MLTDRAAFQGHRAVSLLDDMEEHQGTRHWIEPALILADLVEDQTDWPHHAAGALRWMARYHRLPMIDWCGDAWWLLHGDWIEDVIGPWWFDEEEQMIYQMYPHAKLDGCLWRCLSGRELGLAKVYPSLALAIIDLTAVLTPMEVTGC